MSDIWHPVQDLWVRAYCRARYGPSWFWYYANWCDSGELLM
jgi:hypothetical protein